MNKFGSIAQFETPADAEAAGYKTKLKPAEAKALLGTNRHERRAQLAKMRCDARKSRKAR